MSQIPFFSLREDEQQFVRWLVRESGSFVMNGRSSKSQEVVPIADEAALTAREILVFPALGATRIRLERKAADGSFIGDLYAQAFAEIMFSRSTDSGLVPGRIYAKLGWEKTEDARVAHRRWYDRICRWIRKESIEIHAPWRAFPKAHRWFVEGGTLYLGDERAMQLHHEPKA
jgi:hypothetical protein